MKEAEWKASGEAHEGSVTDSRGSGEEDRARARSFCLILTRHRVLWRVVVTGGVALGRHGRVHLCFLPNPWRLYPVSHLVAGSR